MITASLPKKWTKRRLRFDARLNPVKSELTLEGDAEVSFVPMDAVGELGGLRLDEKCVLDDVYNGYTYFRDGDVVVAKITPCFENGKTALASGLINGVGFGTTELHVVRPGETLDARYLFYLTIAHDFRSFGAAEMLGAGGQKRVPERFFKDWRIALPSLETQKRLAAFLDKKTAQIDALIQKKRKLLDQLMEKRQAIITQAVTKGLNPSAAMKDSGIDWIGQIPAHWTVNRLKYLVRDRVGLQMGPFGGMLTDLSPEPTGFKLYGQENTISGNFELGNRWVEEQRFRNLARYQLQANDLVITRKGSLGSCRRFPPDALPGLADSDTIIIRFNEKKLRSALAIILLHEAAYVAAQIESTRRGAILAGLNSTVVGDLWLVCPSNAEQDAVIKWCETSIAEIDTLIDAIEKSVKQASEYRSALITAAVTGQLQGLQ